MKAITDYERLYEMFRPYAKNDEWGEVYCTFEKDRIILHTDDSYCYAELIFNEKGKFIGFIDN